MARVLSVKGDRDAIRWGSLRLENGEYRRFQFDRFTGSLGLWKMLEHGKPITPVVDMCPQALTEATDALLQRIGLVKA